MTYARQFFDFLYDFLVGDAWELFVGPIAALVVGWVLIQAGVGATVVGVFLFVVVVAIGTTSVLAALRHAS